MADVPKTGKKNKSGKGKPGRPSVYSPQQREKALTLVPKVGLAKAAMSLKIPKSTLHEWCKDAGVPTSTEESKAKTEAATQASILSRREKIAATRLKLAENLSEIAVAGTEVELARLKLALQKGGELVMVDRLSEVVGARTRAIHDLELIEGRATERTEAVDSVEDILALQAELEEREG